MFYVTQEPSSGNEDPKEVAKPTVLYQIEQRGIVEK